MTTTLLAKDTAHRPRFRCSRRAAASTWRRCRAAAISSWSPDPTTFRVLPWANGAEHRLDAVRHLFHQRQAGAVLDAAGAARCAGAAGERGLRFPRRARSRIPSVQAGESAACAGRCHLAAARAGGQPAQSGLSVSHRERASIRSTPALEPIRRGIAALGLPLRSLEVELGPSQCEFTFRPQIGLDAADTMILFRAAVKQIARRNGLLASFMCRPALPNLFSCGWHLHQSLIEREAQTQRLRRATSAKVLSPLGAAFPRRPAGACARRGRVHHADRQRLQALPRLFAGARPRDLGARQSRRHGARARPARRCRRRIWKTASASRPPIRISTWRRRSMPASTASRASVDPGPSADTPYETTARAAAEESRRSAGGAARQRRCSAQASATAFVDYFVRTQGSRVRALQDRSRPARAKSRPGSRTNISICSSACSARSAQT